MVFFTSMIQAELVNCTELQPMDAGSFTYLLSLCCTSCRTISPKEVCLSADHMVPVSQNQNHNVNFLRKCSECQSIGTITLMEGRSVPLSASHSIHMTPTTLMVFDCSGLEPVSVSFGSAPWKAISVSGVSVENITLQPGGAAYESFDDYWKVHISVDNFSTKLVVSDDQWKLRKEVKNRYVCGVRAGGGGVVRGLQVESHLNKDVVACGASGRVGGYADAMRKKPAYQCADKFLQSKLIMKP